MLYYLTRSRYRLLIAGLVLGLIGLWYLWYTTDQIVSAAPIVLTTGFVLLNIALGFFSFTRHHYVTKFIFIFTYGILVLSLYSLYVLSRGIR